MNSEMFYTYILCSLKNRSYYIGSCNDLNKRISLHNRGLVKSTKRYIPWGLVYFEQYPNLKNARARELKIKRWKKREAIEKLVKHFRTNIINRGSSMP